MANNKLDKAFAEMLKDSTAMATKALVSAAEKAQADIMVEADKYLEKYYSQYKPTRYKRAYQLRQAIEPTFRNNMSNGEGSITIGVKYNPTSLMKAYRSKSWYHQSGTRWISRRDGDFDFDSQNNGEVEASWIVDNFVEGIHPRSYPDALAGYIYAPKQFKGESTDTLMTEFFEHQLPNRINQYFADELINTIMNNL